MKYDVSGSENLCSLTLAILWIGRKEEEERERGEVREGEK